MNRRIIGFILGIIALVVIVFAATSIIGSTDNCAAGAQDQPPPGAPTPNAGQMSLWPAIRAEMLEQGGAGGSVSSDPNIPPDFNEQSWLDPQPAEDLGATVGGAAVALEGAPCV